MHLSRWSVSLVLLASVLTVQCAVVVEKKLHGRPAVVIPHRVDFDWRADGRAGGTRVKRASSDGTCGLGNNTVLEINPVRKGSCEERRGWFCLGEY